MAGKQRSPELVVANLSLPQIEAAIPKIDRRIEDLRAFDINSVNELFDPRVGVFEKQLDALLVSIFGVGTVEYARYNHGVTSLNQTSFSYTERTPVHEVRENLQKNFLRAITNLEALKKGFMEELQDAGHTMAGRALKAYEGLALHPSIEKAAGQLYRDGHYANAIEDAVKALNALVRLNAGIDDKDGTSLMETVFSPNAPILKINALADQNDINEQRGFMMMFSGVVTGLRNPRAHSIIKDDPEMALEFIAFISLLAKFVDKASK